MLVARGSNFSEHSWHVFEDFLQRNNISRFRLRGLFQERSGGNGGRWRSPFVPYELRHVLSRGQIISAIKFACRHGFVERDMFGFWVYKGNSRGKG